MSGWEVAGYGLFFTALLLLGGFIIREFVLDGREHQAANEQIGAKHQPVLRQAQAWQESSGAGTTAFPASHPRTPSRLEKVVAWFAHAWSTLVAQLRGGDRFATPGGKHTPTTRWTTRDVARHVAARSHLSDDEVWEIAQQEFDAGLTVGRAPEAGSMPARLPWDVLDRAQGSAPVYRPFHELVRDRDDVLHGRMRAAANDEPTTMLPTVAPDGAR